MKRMDTMPPPAGDPPVADDGSTPSVPERPRSAKPVASGRSASSAPVAGHSREYSRGLVAAAECVKIHALRGRLLRRVAIERTADRSHTSVATFDSRTGRETNRWVMGIDIVLTDTDRGAEGTDCFSLLEPSTQKVMTFVRADEEGPADFAALVAALGVAANQNALQRADICTAFLSSTGPKASDSEWEQPAKMEGWLHKKGDVAKGLKKRWFVIEKGSKKMAYFSRKLRVKKGEIDLSAVLSLVEGFHGQFLVVTEKRAYDLHVVLPKQATHGDFATSAQWLRVIGAETGIVAQGNINSPSGFPKVTRRATITALKDAGALLPGGGAVATLAAESAQRAEAARRASAVSSLRIAGTRDPVRIAAHSIAVGSASSYFDEAELAEESSAGAAQAVATGVDEAAGAAAEVAPAPGADPRDSEWVLLAKSDASTGAGATQTGARGGCEVKARRESHARAAAYAEEAKIAIASVPAVGSVGSATSAVTAAPAAAPATAQVNAQAKTGAVASYGAACGNAYYSFSLSSAADDAIAAVAHAAAAATPADPASTVGTKPPHSAKLAARGNAYLYTSF